MTWWQRRGLRFKIGALLLLILLVVIGGVLYAIIRRTQAAFWQREVQAATQVTALVAVGLENTMLNNRWDQAQAVLENLGRQGQVPIEDIAVLASKTEQVAGISYQRTVAVLFVTGFPGRRTVREESVGSEPIQPGCWVCHQLPPEERPATAIVEVEGQEVLRAVFPMRNEPQCRTCHGAEKPVLGITLLDISTAPYRRTIDQVTAELAVGGGLAVLLCVAGIAIVMRLNVLRPLRDLLHTTQAIARGEWAQRVPVRSQDELGRLGMAFNEMSAQLAMTYTELDRALAQQKAQAVALQEAMEELSQSHEEQSRLLETVRQMSTPVVPVHREVLVMPLVGLIDSERAQRIQEALLRAIEERGARVVLLDITGVPMVDTAVAQALLEAAQAARLLGAETVLVGITPQVAETLVSLGVDLSALVTRSDLQSGLAYVLRKL